MNIGYLNNINVLFVWFLMISFILLDFCGYGFNFNHGYDHDHDHGYEIYVSYYGLLPNKQPTTQESLLEWLAF